ncbi:DUF882 domain-containing protein [Candidatus Pacearchaeota archaeon]|nr:DUF882 domain-containing protein [Candidatus Pacearchaeota archaeon]
MKISEHFNRNEFVCNDGCGGNTVDVELITVLERLRKHCNSGLTVVSGFRCKEHNAYVGGAKKSRHLNGKAADISVSAFSPKQIGEILDKWYPDKYGIGVYRNWVHVDVRQKIARW